jgi:NADH-quinone oxidoreductase subunit K
MNLNSVLVLGALISTIGILGILLRKNLVIMLMSLELIVLGGAVGLLGGARSHGALAHAVPDGALFIPFIFRIAAADACIGLTLIMTLFKTQKTLWVDEMDNS